jgi:hypothetical protein
LHKYWQSSHVHTHLALLPAVFVVRPLSQRAHRPSVRCRRSFTPSGRYRLSSSSSWWSSLLRFVHTSWSRKQCNSARSFMRGLRVPMRSVRAVVPPTHRVFALCAHMSRFPRLARVSGDLPYFPNTPRAHPVPIRYRTPRLTLDKFSHCYRN